MITYHIFRDAIVIHTEYGGCGKTITVSKSDERYQKVLDAINKNKLEEAGHLADNAACLEIEDLLGI